MKIAIMLTHMLSVFLWYVCILALKMPHVYFEIVSCAVWLYSISILMHAEGEGTSHLNNN